METPSTSSRFATANLDVGYLFSRSWEVFKENWALLAGVFLVYSILSGGPSQLSDEDSLFGSLIGLIQLIITGPLLAGTYYVALKLIRREPAEFVEMFDGFKVFGKAVGVFILYSVLLGIGIILLIVPGIIVAVGLWPAMFLVTQADLGITDTLRKAWDMTRGYKMNLFLVGLALFGLNLLGLLAFIVGVIFTGAFSLLVVAAAYDELEQASEV
jgi:uncharacterized membrane protein